MAAQAGIQNLFGRKQGEGANRRFAAVMVDVISTGAVTTLAPRIFRNLLAQGHALEVRVLIKVVRLEWMAQFAFVVTDEAIGLRMGEAGDAAEHGEKKSGTNQAGH